MDLHHQRVASLQVSSPPNAAQPGLLLLLCKSAEHGRRAPTVETVALRTPQHASWVSVGG